MTVFILARRGLEPVTRFRLAALAATAAAAVAIAAWLPPATAKLPEDDAIAEPVRGAVHVHTRRSDGSGSVDQIAAAAGKAGLRFVILTDHGSGFRLPEPPSYRHGVLCIDAAEISTGQGHIVALGLWARTPYPLGGDARDVVEDVARLGGFSIAAHPASPTADLQWQDWELPVDGLEWLNADSEWRDEAPASLARALLTYPFRKAETMAALLDRPVAVLERWDRLATRRRVVALAAADAHARMGALDRHNPYGDRSPLAIPGYEHVFRAFSIALPELQLTGEPDADARAVVDEIRAGRLYSTVDALARPARLAFDATSGGKRAGPGEELTPSEAVSLHVRTTAPRGARIDLLRDGTRVASAEGTELRFDAPPARGAYRVEVHIPGTTVPWILSNPVYVGGFEPVRSREAADVQASAVLYDNGPLASGWGIEKNAESEGVLDAVPTLDGRRLSLRYSLGGLITEGPYAAIVIPIDGKAATYDRLIFTTEAIAPMRLWLQFRVAMPEGERYWRRSVYVDASSREVSVPFEEMTSAGSARLTPEALSRAHALMFVVDAVHTALGTAGRVWIDDIRYAR